MDLQLTAFQFVTQYGSTGPFNLPLTPRRVNRWLENPTRRNTKRGIGKIRHATFNIYPCFKRRQPEAPALCIQQKYSFKVLWGNGWTFHSQGQKSRCMVLCNSHGYQGNLEAKRLCSHWIECSGTNIKVTHLYDFAPGPGKFSLTEAEICISQVWDGTNFLPGYNLLHISHYIPQNSPQSSFFTWNN